MSKLQTYQGKTRQVLVAIIARLQKGRGERCLVLSPPSIISTWIEEAMLVLRDFPKLRETGFETVEYSSKNSANVRDELLRRTRDKGKPLLVIASTALVGGANSRRKQRPTRYDNPLFPTGKKDSGWNWHFLVVDEAHRGARNPKTDLGYALRSKRSNLALDSFIMLLTATPIENNLEVGPQARWSLAP
jgi:SNF2 family DNA or RNA helicase